MFDLMLFTDGSVDAKTRIGFGAYLAINNMESSLADLKSKVKVKQFENTSSTTLELQTLLWAIDDVCLLRTEKMMRVAVYSDSQNTLGLLALRINDYGRAGARHRENPGQACRFNRDEAATGSLTTHTTSPALFEDTDHARGTPGLARCARAFSLEQAA